MFQEEIRIPKDRIPMLIGKKGATKKLIQRKTGTKIRIDSKEGDVIIEGEDSLNVYQTKRVIQSIARGINPEKALILLDEGSLDIINIQDFSGKSKAKQMRLKARVIGTKGKARELLERLTNTEIVVYGKTITIVGKPEDVILAKSCVERLLQGAPHGNVYRWIEKQKSHHFS
mgnify:CR=1 FL=1